MSNKKMDDLARIFGGMQACADLPAFDKNTLKDPVIINVITLLGVKQPGAFNKITRK